MRPICLSLSLAFAVTAAALPLAASAATAASKPSAGSTIELGDFMGRLRTIEVVVGDQRGTFLVDTGGGVTFVTPQFAERIGCKPWGQITGFRLSGERLDMARCDGVTIGLPGGKAFAPATIGMFDLEPLMPQGAPVVEGSLALDALDGQVFTLDLRAGTLEFETPESLAGIAASSAVQVPIRVARHGASGHGLGVYARSKTAKGDLWMEIDSGGDAPVLLPAKVAAAAGADPAIAKVQPYTLVLSGVDRDVKLEARALVRDMIHDGLVGVPLLVNWRLTFDLAGDRLWIAPTKG